MRVGILSDTHGHTERTKAAVERLRHEGARVLFHCGDITIPETAAVLTGPNAFVCLGNNDRDEKGIRAALERAGASLMPLSGEVTIEGKRLAFTHGHNKREVRRLLATRPDYLFLGHSHRLTDHRERDTRVINPGALHRAPKWTVALLDLQTGRVRFLEIEEPKKRAGSSRHPLP